MKEITFKNYKEYKEFKKAQNNYTITFKDFLTVKEYYFKNNIHYYSDTEISKIRLIRKVLYKEFKKVLKYKEIKEIKIGKEVIYYLRDNTLPLKSSTFVYKHLNFSSLFDSSMLDRKMLNNATYEIAEEIFKKYNK